jgi:hypothetical protein
MLSFLRRRFDELATIVFLLLALVLTILHPPVYATAGGITLARWVLWGAGILLVALLIGVRFNTRIRPVLDIVLQIGPMVVAVVGYVSLRLFNAGSITNWLGISSKDPWMMAADIALFGKTPYVWFGLWGFTNTSFLLAISWFYGLYPFLPVAALAWFWFKGDRCQFRLIRRTVLISLYCGYWCYILIPVAGPLSLMPNAAPSYIESTAGYAFLAGNFRYPFDCFPSLHTANPWLLVWLCRGGKLPLWLMTATIFACCAITLSTLVLGLHYGIDDLAGLVWIFPISLIARSTLPRETAS